MQPPPESGLVLEGLPAGMRPPLLPDMRQPPPGHNPAGPPIHKDNLSIAPPPLPAKALEQMQQISNLLNAQAKLAELAPPLGGKDKEQQPGILGPPPGLPNLSMPPPSLDKLRGSVGVMLVGAGGPNVFKKPLPPPPLNMNNSRGQDINRGLQGDKKLGHAAPDSTETTEVVDMDVASPYSDDEVGINISFSPPLKKRSRRNRDRDRDENKPKRDNIQDKINEVFAKQERYGQNHTSGGSRARKKDKVSVIIF